MEGAPGGQDPVPGRTPIRSHESTVSLWYVAVGWMGALLCQSPWYDHSEGEVVPGSHRWRTAPPAPHFSLPHLREGPGEDVNALGVRPTAR